MSACGGVPPLAPRPLGSLRNSGCATASEVVEVFSKTIRPRVCQSKIQAEVTVQNNSEYIYGADRRIELFGSTVWKVQRQQYLVDVLRRHNVFEVSIVNVSMIRCYHNYRWHTIRLKD